MDEILSGQKSKSVAELDSDYEKWNTTTMEMLFSFYFSDNIDFKGSDFDEYFEFTMDKYLEWTLREELKRPETFHTKARGGFDPMPNFESASYLLKNLKELKAMRKPENLKEDVRKYNELHLSFHSLIEKQKNQKPKPQIQGMCVCQ